MGKHTNYEELVGKNFKELTVEKVIVDDKNHKLLQCICNCGKTHIQTYASLKKQVSFCECKKTAYQEERIGEKFNKLTIKSPDKNNINNVIVSCECGNEKSVNFTSLIKLDIKSCGCINKQKDVVGEKYNRFTIIENLPSKKWGKETYKMVKAVCDCGSIRDLTYRDLKRNIAKSCGCINEERKTIVNRGDKYNYWTLLEEVSPYLDKQGNKSRKVLCECICGKQSEIILNTLRQGTSNSCGCMTDYSNKMGKRLTEDSPIPVIDLEKINNRDIGHWTVIEEISAKRNEKAEIIRIVKAQCKCGYIKEIKVENLQKSKQCIKCANEEIKSRISEEDRILKKRLHSVYGSIKSRCTNPNSKDYKKYGAKGIKVESSFDSFPKFFKWIIDNGYTYDCKLEIDRKNCDGNYSADNCRLVSKEENILNMKSINLTLDDVYFIRSEEFDFETMKDNYTCEENVIKRIMNYETFKTI